MAHANRTIISNALSVMTALSISAVAQFAPVSVATAQTPPAQKWFKVCAKQADNDICNVQYHIYAENGQLISTVNLLSVTGKINRKIFQVTVPSYRLIPAGVAIKIDQKKENRIPYVHCLPNRCAAEVKLDDNLIKVLKSGGEMLVTSVNVQNRPTPIKVSLKGFTAAFDGPPIKRDELEKDNAALQKQLEKRAKEAREALEKAQKEALE